MKSSLLLALPILSVACAGAPVNAGSTPGAPGSPQAPAGPPVVVGLPPPPPAPKEAPAEAEAPKAEPAAPEEPAEPAAQFGVIGLLNAAGADPNAPTAPWGRLDDQASRQGGLMGVPGPVGGFGLSGVGAGGRAEGLGLGGRGQHVGHPPLIRQGATTVQGRLPPEVVQRIVRQHLGSFRRCYENGLRSDPQLQGRVSVRFVIGRDGKVSNVANAGSDLPSASVLACVVRAFQGIIFPAPDGGMVVVTYPLVFSPGDLPPPASGTSPTTTPSTAPSPAVPAKK
jgi:hypothetical protein